MTSTFYRHTQAFHSGQVVTTPISFIPHGDSGHFNALSPFVRAQMAHSPNKYKIQNIKTMKTVNKALSLVAATTLFGLLAGGVNAQTTWAQWDGVSTNQLTDANGVVGTYTTNSGGAPAPAIDDFAFTSSDYLTATSSLNVSSSIDYIGVGDPDATDANRSYTFNLSFSSAIQPGTIIFLESLNQEDLALTADGSFELTSFGNIRLDAPGGIDGTTMITPITQGFQGFDFNGNSIGSRFGHFMEVTSAITQFNGVVTDTGSFGPPSDYLYLTWASPASSVPEPSSALLSAMAGGLFLVRRRR